jgi:hypothetical protein
MYEVLDSTNTVYDQQSGVNFQATGKAYEVAGSELTQHKLDGVPVLNAFNSPKSPYDTNVYFRIPAVNSDTGKRIHLIAPFDGAGKSALTQKLDIVG